MATFSRTTPRVFGRLASEMRAARRAEEAGINLAVVRVKKNGEPSAVSTANPRFDHFSDREAAERRVASLEKLNPGSTYTIVSL